MRSRWLAALLLAALSLFTFACGKDSNTNNQTGPSCTVTGLTLTPATDFVRTKATETFGVTAACSGGTTQPVQGTWGTDAPSVATVDATGKVTGVGSGQVTVFADYQGFRGTRLVRVVPDYQGRWSGDWSVTGCTENGDFAGICAGYVVGDLYGLTLVSNQARDTMTGTTDFGDNLPGPVTGTIQMNGHLVVNGTYTITSEGVTIEITVSNWDTFTADNLRMTGHLRVTGRAVGLQGSFSVDGDLRIVTKTSTTPAGSTPTGTPALRPALARLRAIR
jgi:hypothetical protein